jgi:diguanylate cyclase (GGDEF)-like protein
MRNSIRLRIFGCLLLALFVGAALALLARVSLRGWRGLSFPVDHGFVLILALIITMLIVMAFVSTMLRPVTMLSRRLSKLRSREELYQLNPAEFAELAPVVETMLDFVRRAENQQNTAAAIHQASRKRIEHMAENDALTGLRNRHYLQKVLPALLANAASTKDHLSVIMLDVDHFKHYNDTNGHPEGDKVLVQLAEILNRSTRQYDVCSRYGGEEFLIVLPTANRERARSIAERIRGAVEQAAFPHGERQPLGRVTASFGVATFPDHGSGSSELIERADQALYLSKQRGRNRIHTYDDVLAGELDVPKPPRGKGNQCDAAMPDV